MAEPARPYRVSSLFLNIELLLREKLHDVAPAYLGARWSFGAPQLTRALTEYSFPIGYVEQVLRRTGIRLIEYRAATEELLAHLQRGRGAVVAVDSFYLPYRPAYNRVHSSRTILVRGASQGTCWIDDRWPPGYRGAMPLRHLIEAMSSEVPHDPVREPIFSGVPIGGTWFTAVLDAMPEVADLGTWLIDLIAELVCEAAETDAQAGEPLGLRGFEISLPGLQVRSYRGRMPLRRRRCCDTRLSCCAVS